MFLPFQRLGDTDNSAGVGLGLALAKGFVEGMGGTLRRRTRPAAGSPWWLNWRWRVRRHGGGMKILSRMTIRRSCAPCESRSPHADTRCSPHPTAARRSRAIDTIPTLSYSTSGCPA